MPEPGWGDWEGDPGIRELEFPAQSPDLQGERGWRLRESPSAKDLPNAAYLMGHPIKPLKNGVWGASPLEVTRGVRGGGCAGEGEGLEALRPSLPTKTLCPRHLFHLAIPDFRINWKFVVNCSKVTPEFCELL